MEDLWKRKSSQKRPFQSGGGGSITRTGTQLRNQNETGKGNKKRIGKAILSPDGDTGVKGKVGENKNMSCQGERAGDPSN